jgi:hypothetical protein
MCHLLAIKDNGHRIVEDAVQHKVICKMILIHLDAKHSLAIDTLKSRNEPLGNALLEALGDGIGNYFVME